MRLIRTAKLNGHDPYAYSKDILQRLTAQGACETDKMLPHRW